MSLIHRNTCRVCGKGNLKEVVSLGSQNLQGSFIKKGVYDPPTRKIPCTLVRCDPERDEEACGLLQMKHSVPPQLMYSDYWYRSGTNQTMRDHLEGISLLATGLIKRNHASVLDIGCNDGTLLGYFPNSWVRVGIDPSNIESKVPGITVIKDIFPSQKLQGNFDVVTSIAMFYDLEYPVKFASEIRSILKPDGVWILEMSYMPRMLENLSYDTICFEHLEYYTLSVIENICKQAGLKVVFAGENVSNGGSLCCAIVREESEAYESRYFGDKAKELRAYEFDMLLDTDAPYDSFKIGIEDHRNQLLNLLNGMKALGKSIHVYGASTKGNTILQYCGIGTDLIDFAADRNPSKNGAFTPGSNIPIISEEESRAMNPDYYLALPWHFREEFISREIEFLARGGKFIFPLPTIEVIGT